MIVVMEELLTPKSKEFFKKILKSQEFKIKQVA